MGEFETIAKYFAPLAGPGGLGLSDDAAVLSPPPGRDLVITADAMIEGVHFRSADPPEMVGRKLLRINLSDLAAMGAKPLSYVMTVGVRAECGDAWFEAFARGLAVDQQEFDIRMSGGDTVLSPHSIALSLTAFGTAPAGRALRRSTAREGDDVWVSGVIGDGLLGLKVLTEEWEVAEPKAVALRYQLPSPRLALGERLIGIANAALDVSDGVVADLGHICETSSLAAEIDLAKVPFSRSGKDAMAAKAITPAEILGGGDDYELLFTAAPEKASAIEQLALSLDLPLTRIGRMTSGSGVVVRDENGQKLDLKQAGYTHF